MNFKFNSASFFCLPSRECWWQRAYLCIACSSSHPHSPSFFMAEKKKRKRGFEAPIAACRSVKSVRGHLWCQQLDYMTDSLSFKPRFSMSGECSGAGTDGSPSSLMSLSSAPSSCLAVRSTKNCKSPAPKASPSTFSTVQVRSLKTEQMARNWSNCPRQQLGVCHNGYVAVMLDMST